MKHENEVAAARKALTRAEQNKKLVRQAIEEVWNNGNYGNIENFVSYDFVVHGSTQNFKGHRGVKEFYTSLREAFPGWMTWGYCSNSA